MHSLPFAVNCSILFAEVPLLDRPQAAKDAGFDAVEFWWPFPKAVPSGAEVDIFMRAVEDAGVALAGLNFAAGDMAAGARGLVSWPGRTSEFRDNVDVVIGIGDRLGCRAFNALYGNRIQDVPPQMQDELALENVTVAAAAAERIGGTVLLEPISGADRYPLRTMADVLRILDKVSADGRVGNLGVLADLYHLAVNGDDVANLVTKHASRICHVQIADSPGRNEPGSGNLPIDAWLSDLERAGYGGWIGLEYHPSSSTNASFEWLPPDRRAAGRTR